MLLQEYLCETHQYATPEQWGVVRGSLPAQWIEQALQATGVATLRPRPSSGESCEAACLRSGLNRRCRPRAWPRCA
ncbi:hypothetical protein QMO14_31435, partial [Variovorax sp. CAN2819]|nr:hypothetical protein [Variovorax sp. CAN15]